MLEATTSINNAEGRQGGPASVDSLAALVEHRDRQIEAIRRTSDALFSHPSVDAMVRETLNIALEVLRADAGTVFLHDKEKNVLVFRYVIGGGGESLIGKSLPVTNGIAGTVFRTHKPLLTHKVEDSGDFDPGVDQQTGYQTKSMMTVPVKRTDGAPIGVMQVLNARVPFTERDLEVLEVLCAQAATGIEHAKLAQDAKRAEMVHVIGDISHDIKNMLTPILTGVWTLEPMLKRLFENLDEVRLQCPDSEPWGNEVTQIVDAIRHDYGWMLDNILLSAEQVQSRTKEIADAIKGETSPPLFELADFNDTCRNVVNPLKIVADKAKVEIRLELDSLLPPVEFDRKQIYNALYNLINNAIPFTPAGGSVTVRTIAPDTDPQTFVVQVQDTGVGMPEHVRERLFTDKAISTTVVGTGLGTRIVAGVVQRHHGKITVQSAVGAGSTFTLHLPLRHLESEG